MLLLFATNWVTLMEQLLKVSLTFSFLCNSDWFARSIDILFYIEIAFLN